MSAPARSHCRTDGPASLVSASTACWKSGCSSCRAGVHSSAAEMRKMKGGQAKPGAGRWMLGEAGELAGIVTQAQSSRIRESREEG